MTHTDPHRTDALDDEREKAAFLAELLGAPTHPSVGLDDAAPQCAQPGTDAERVLLGIWRETLGAGVSLDDNYFALGGTSLKSLQISARASRAGFAVTMRDIVEHPTVRALAANVAACGRAAAPVRVEPERDAPGLVYPSSGMQEAMLFQCIAAPGHALYLSQFGCLLVGPLDGARFRDALELLARRHPALRAAFPARMLARRSQLIHDDIVLDYTYDVGAFPDDGPPSDGRSLLEELARAERERPFDLGRAPLWRVRVVALARDTHAWIWTQHHLIADGRAQECLMTEFALLYERLCRGAAVEIAEDPSYRDALAEVHAARERGRHFWVDYLAHFDAPLPLERHATPMAAASAVAMQPVERRVGLTGEQTAALTAALARAELTVGSALAAWFALALCAGSEQRDLLIGLVTSGRQGERARYRNTVGNLIGTVPLRATLNRGRTLRQWTQGIQHTIAQLQQYEQTSPQEIKRWIGQLGPQPLFDALFVHEGFGKPEVLFGTAAGLRVECSRFTVNEGYPLVLVADEGECLNLTLRYLPQACPDGFAQALLERLVRLCTGWPDAGERDVVDVASERR